MRTVPVKPISWSSSSLHVPVKYSILRSDPVCPPQHLAALPADRRAALSAVRKTINENLPGGYEEGLQFGMIGWYVPLSVYPAGYGENPKVPRFPEPSRRLP